MAINQKVLANINASQSSIVWLSAIRLALVIFVAAYGIFYTASVSQWFFLGSYSVVVLLLYWQEERLGPSISLGGALILDLLFIGGFLYINDGLMSGWVSALLFPTVAGSLTCSKRVAWVIAVVAMLCYTALVYLHFGEMASGAHQHMQSSWMEHPQISMVEHIEGMLITFCISVSLITGFISYQTKLVRQHQLTLSVMREKQWRERQIMAFATLSANTTHQLASPISTITLLLEELDESDPTREWLDERLFSQLQQQTQRCTEALQSIATITRDYDPNKQGIQNVSEWLYNLVKGWWVTRNEVQYQLEISPELGKFTLVQDENVSFALVNFLDNAANACQNASDPKVTIDATISFTGGAERGSNTEAISSANGEVNLQLDIRDNGEGVPEQLAAVWGRQFVASSGNGLGIGATLAHAAIEQSGGEVNLLSTAPAHAANSNSEKATTYIRVILPIHVASER